MAQKKNARGQAKKGRYSSSFKVYSYATNSSARPLKLKDLLNVFLVTHFLPTDI